MMFKCVCLLALTCTWFTWVHASEPPQLKTASSHPIQYYLSLPEGWTAGKRWPVVVVIESAERTACCVVDSKFCRNERYALLARQSNLHADAESYESGGCSWVQNVSLTHVEGKGHERLADEVLVYFASLIEH
jgi:hypothetical protein